MHSLSALSMSLEAAACTKTGEIDVEHVDSIEHRPAEDMTNSQQTQDVKDV